MHLEIYSFSFAFPYPIKKEKNIWEKKLHRNWNPHAPLTVTSQHSPTILSTTRGSRTTTTTPRAWVSAWGSSFVLFVCVCPNRMRVRALSLIVKNNHQKPWLRLINPVYINDVPSTESSLDSDLNSTDSFSASLVDSLVSLFDSVRWLGKSPSDLLSVSRWLRRCFLFRFFMYTIYAIDNSYYLIY